MADLALQRGEVGLAFAAAFDTRRAAGAASGTGKSLLAIAFPGSAPVIELTALDLQLAS